MDARSSKCIYFPLNVSFLPVLGFFLNFIFIKKKWSTLHGHSCGPLVCMYTHTISGTCLLPGQQPSQGGDPGDGADELHPTGRFQSWHRSRQVEFTFHNNNYRVCNLYTEYANCTQYNGHPIRIKQYLHIHTCYDYWWICFEYVLYKSNFFAL